VIFELEIIASILFYFNACFLFDYSTM